MGLVRKNSTLHDTELTGARWQSKPLDEETQGEEGQFCLCSASAFADATELPHSRVQAMHSRKHTCFSMFDVSLLARVTCSTVSGENNSKNACGGAGFSFHEGDPH